MSARVTKTNVVTLFIPLGEIALWDAAFVCNKSYTGHGPGREWND